MSTETNTSKSIMFTFYDEISFIVLISFIDYSSGEGILEHSIQKGSIEIKQRESRTSIKERWLNGNDTDTEDEIEKQNIIAKCYDLGGEPWEENPRVCCSKTCRSKGQTFCGKPNCAEGPGGEDACCPWKIIRPCAMPPCRLDGTECSGGNFKQFQCKRPKSHCIRPICAGNRCIPHSWRNDGENDCSDNSDEDCLKYQKYCEGDRIASLQPIASSFDCSKECLKRDDCKFWHYYVGVYEEQGKQCILYKNCEYEKEEPDNVLGEKNCAGEKNDCAWYGYHCDLNINSPIEPRGGVGAFEWKECAQLCQENPKCQFWHYWMTGKSCLFFDSCHLKEEETSISGSRYCPAKGNVTEICDIHKINRHCTPPCSPGSCKTAKTCSNSVGVSCWSGGFGDERFHADL